MRLFLAIMVAFSLGLSAGEAGAQSQTAPALQPEPTATIVILDGLIGRPLGLAATVTGTATFIATLPFSLPTGDIGRAARGMIGEPAAWTFRRPLGKDDPRRYESFFFK